MEEWRKIDGFENYEVSNEGRIRSVDHETEQRISGGVVVRRHYKGKILIPQESGDNYLYVGICKEGKRYKKRIHRLVAQAFLPNENSLPDVNHKDENKHNNFVFVNEDGTIDYEKSNLEWCTAEYNHNYGTHNQRVANANSKQVGQFTLDETLIKIWPSAIEADRNGFDNSCVSKCCHGKQKTYKGYIWRYIN